MSSEEAEQPAWARHINPPGDRSLRCRLGLHSWSTNRGGIKICERSGCRAAKTFGFTGSMRRLEFQAKLYEQYQRITSEDDHAE